MKAGLLAIASCVVLVGCSSSYLPPDAPDAWEPEPVEEVIPSVRVEPAMPPADEEAAVDLCMEATAQRDDATPDSPYEVSDVETSDEAGSVWVSGDSYLDDRGEDGFLVTYEARWRCIVVQGVITGYDATLGTPVNVGSEERNDPADAGPGCAIKGNVSYNTGERIYHVPGQEYYDETVINPSYGERWFCTEEEAEDAGWRKSFQ